MEIYLVGGYIRDELLGRMPGERDFVVLHATEEEFFRRFPRAKKVGKRKCVYLIGRDEYVLSEFPSIEEDLFSRDLTINAIARDSSGRLYAHPLSFSDLEKGILRPISRKNFERDPLRVYRAARFAALFPRFSIHISLVHTLREIGGDGALMKTIAKERIASEVLKALSSPSPSRFFKLLIDCRATAYWMEEFTSTDYRDEYSHFMDGCREDSLCVWLGFCYYFMETQGNIRGKDGLLAMTKRMGLPRKFIEATRLFCRFYPAFLDFSALSYEEKIRMLISLDKRGLVAPFFKMVDFIKGHSFLKEAERCLDLIKSVHLPPSLRGLGRRSGEMLLKMRIEVLKGAGL